MKHISGGVIVIIENSGVKGLKSDLAHLDEVADKLGFVRWQWEYTRATYDYKLQDASGEYYLRVNCRTESGKLESPYAILVVEDVYMGKATFPHGLDYQSPVPEPIVKAATGKLAELSKALTE
jgi:hypothetical protein